MTQLQHHHHHTQYAYTPSSPAINQRSPNRNHGRSQQVYVLCIRFSSIPIANRYLQL